MTYRNAQTSTQATKPIDTSRRMRKLRAGIRVRVKSEAKSPYAGQQGVVLFAGDKVCDVKFLPKRKKKQASGGLPYTEGLREQRIDSIPREWLESTRPGIDLVAWLEGRHYHNRYVLPSNRPRRLRLFPFRRVFRRNGTRTTIRTAHHIGYDRDELRRRHLTRVALGCIAAAIIVVGTFLIVR